MLCRAVLGLTALFACAAVAHAQQTAEPLTLKLTSSRQLCTAGTLTQVSWIISGGAPPYALTINGEEVAAAAPHALASCGAMVEDDLEWLLGIGRQRHVTAVATDSLGAATTASARLTLAAALEPPADVQSRSFLVWLHTPVPVRFEFGDPQIRTRWRAGTPPWQPAARYMLLRWRVQGADRWAYEAPAPVERSESEQSHEWSVDESLMGSVLEIQLAHLRGGVERESPHALSWSPPQLISAAPLPRSIVAKTTHDTITLSWGPNSPGTHYTAALSAGGSDYHAWGSWSIDAESTCPCEAYFDGLLPDTWYRVHVGFAEGKVAPPRWFEVRTEPAPPDWTPDPRLPQNVNAVSVDEGLRIMWEPPLVGPELGYTICMSSDDTPLYPSCRSVAAGERQIVSSMQSPAGGTYRIRVAHRSIPPAVVERVVYVPYPVDGGATAGAPPPPPDIRHKGWVGLPLAFPEAPDWNGLTPFSLVWDEAVEAQRAELEWTAQDRIMRWQVTADEARYSSVRIKTEESPTFRVRYLNEGTWSPWSEVVRTTLVPSSPVLVRLDVRNGYLVVNWRPPWDPQPIDGYRVYICCPNGVEEVIDAENATSILHPIDPGETEYSVSVTAWSREGGEGPRSYTAEYRQGEPPTLKLAHTTYWHPRCLPQAGIKTSVSWEITGGAAPFLLAIDDHAAFETIERRGTTEIRCRPDVTLSQPDTHVVRAELTDYYGRTAAGATRIVYAGDDRLDRIPGQPWGGLYLRSVHRSHVWLSWDCTRWNQKTAIRWRARAEEEWRYAVQDKFVLWRSDPDGVCRGRWPDLEPSTRYEFQLAVYAHPAQLESPETLEWTPTETVTTLGPATDVHLVPEADGVAVSWRSQPDAWAYQIVLRAAGASWWTWREPSGDVFERALFRGLPADVEYDVEIITPPLSNGEEMLTPGYAFAGPFGE